MNLSFYVILCVIFAVISLVLFLKVYFLRKSCREISDGLADILEKDFDTNALLTISSRDRYMRRFAALLNRQLARLRQEHLRCQNGDREIKEAITNISHDLRTPLTAISGYLDLLSRELSAPGQQILREEQTGQECSLFQEKPESADSPALRYLAILQNRTAAMKQLTEELFRYSVILSKPESSPAPLSLNRVLEECLISSYAALNRRNITPVISMPEHSVTRTLDEALLTRIFDNILNNAARYSGGDLRVALTEEGRITFSNLAPGLTPVTAARLFDRYFTVETVPASSGFADSAANLSESAAAAFASPASPESADSDSAAAPSDSASPSSDFTASSSTGLGLSIARLLTERMEGSIDSDYKNGRLYITVQFPR
ncbi:MAG: HAMP domain-containing histidine kinase [Roseburia sp.]|nr:HAMP domain-containing histidine kinase [Roseburia sp.]MCM1097536.1 HAMP domain-containing histidine kinase [Ruminococcus flavefaciens]